MKIAKGLRLPRALFLVALFMLVGLFGGAEPGDARCWGCYYHFIGGGEWLEDWYFEYCGPRDSPGSWDCYMYGEDCIEFGACEDYILV